MLELLVFLLAVGIIIALVTNKKLEIEREAMENKYYVERKKLRAASKPKKKDAEEYEDDVEDFIDSLPKWLRATAEGADIDLEEVYNGNPTELAKIKNILDKNFPQTAVREQGDDPTEVLR